MRKGINRYRDYLTNKITEMQAYEKDFFVGAVKVSWALWTGLGVYRGSKAYVYNYQKEMKNKSPEYIQKNPRLYIVEGVYGLMGAAFYVTPLFLPFTITKEIYRLEINMRGLEKHESYYNLVFY